MFSDTSAGAGAGASASAILYSLVETAKANGLESYSWLRRVMRDLPAAKAVDAIEVLSLWSLHVPDLTSEIAA